MADRSGDDKTAIENKQNFNDIKQYANVIEQRIDDTWCTKESVLRDNMRSCVGSMDVIIFSLISVMR